MKNIIYSSLMLLCCINFNIQAQGIILTPVDSIGGRIKSIQFEVNKAGERYYRIESSGLDTFINVNNFEVETAPNFLSRLVLVRLNSDGALEYTFTTAGHYFFLDRDEDVTLFYGLNEDSVVLGNTTLHSDVAKEGGNTLFLLRLDEMGNIEIRKQWDFYDSSYFRPKKYMNFDQSTLFTSTYWGDSLILDDVELPNTLYGNGMLFSWDDSFNVKWLSTFGGEQDEFLYDFDINLFGASAVIGTSASNALVSCNDTLFDSSITLYSDFGFLLNFDSIGNCTNSKQLKSHYGSNYLYGVEYLSDNSLMLAGGFYAVDKVALDDIILEVPSDFVSVFLFHLDKEMTADNGLLITGGEGDKHMYDMLVDHEDNIWLSGYCFADTLIVDTDTLFKSADGNYLYFLCKLDAELNVLKLYKLDAPISKFYEGGDGNMYVRTYTPSGKHLIAIMNEDTISSTTPILEEDLMLELKPNLYRQGESIILDDKLLEDVRHMELFNVSGANFNHCIIKHMSINTSDMPKGHYYIKFLMLDGRPALMRFVLF